MLYPVYLIRSKIYDGAKTTSIDGVFVKAGVGVFNSD